VSFPISLTNKLFLHMNTIYRLLLLMVFGLTFGCKSIIGKVFHKDQVHRVEIATIGSEEASIFNSTFQSVGLISLDDPVKLDVTSVPFTKNSYKDFLTAKRSQSSDLDIGYMDSLKQKPKYLNVKVVDVLHLMDQLHEPDNENVKGYLETNQRAGVVMELSIVFPKTIIDDMLKAEAVFLAQSSNTTYQLQLINKDGEIKQISFKDGVVMGYELSRPCWKKSDRNSFWIVELIGSMGKCSTGTYKSPRFIKSEEDYFKF